MNTSRTGARSLARQAGCQSAYYEHARSYNRDTGLFQPYRHAIVEALALGITSGAVFIAGAAWSVV